MHSSFSLSRVWPALVAAAAFCFSGSTARAFLNDQSTPASAVSPRAISATEIELSWNPSMPDDRYTVVRSVNGGPFVYQPFQVTSGGAARVVYHDRLLLPGTTYAYYIANQTDSWAVSPNQSEVVRTTTPTLADADIGSVGAAGSSTRSGDKFSVSGSGADIWGGADAFHFLSQPWSGDGVMVVRVTGMDNTAQWAKAGVMFRESLAPGSRYVMAAMNPKGDSAILSRSTTGGDSQLGISIYTYIPTWLKLVRHGSHFEASQSRDGSEWIPIGSVDVDLPADGFAGIAVTSHNDGTLCRANFDNFNLSSLWDPVPADNPPSSVQAGETKPGSVQLSWTAPIPATFTIEKSTDGVHFDDVGPTSTDHTVNGLTADTNYFFRVRSIYSGPAFYSDAIGVKTPAAPPDQVPAAPTNLTVTNMGAESATLSWEDHPPVEREYFIDASTDGSNWSTAVEIAQATQGTIGGLSPATSYYFRVRAATGGGPDEGNGLIFSAPAIIQAKTNGVALTLTPTGGPTITQPPQSQTFNADASNSVQLTVGASSDASAYEWRRDGLDVRALQPTLSLPSTFLGNVGLYGAWVANGSGESLSQPAILGATTTKKTVLGTEILTDVHHPNGNIYDQVAMHDAPAVAITADPNQVTRTSFLDPDGDIVQVEFSGAGTLSIVLDDQVSTLQLPNNYKQLFQYWQGRASIVIAGADETTNVGVFSVGRITAVDQSLFYDAIDYDGVADIGYIAIMSRNGRFGGVFAGDTRFSSSHGHTGIFAPGVAFSGPVVIGDVHASGYAFPVLMLGSASDTRVAGGNLAQTNGAPVQISGISQLRFTAGTDSQGRVEPAQTNQATLVENGRDVTSQVVVNPQ